jgi:hypothetical protein
MKDVVRGGRDNDAAVSGFESCLLVSFDVLDITAGCSVTNGGGSSFTSSDGAETLLVLDWG